MPGILRAPKEHEGLRETLSIVQAYYGRDEKGTYNPDDWYLRGMKQSDDAHLSALWDAEPRHRRLLQSVWRQADRASRRRKAAWR